MHISDNSLENILKKSKSIIKNNSIKNTIKLISEIKIPNSDTNLGKTKAFKIYSEIINRDEKYNSKKNANNISSYTNSINKKIKEAYQYV